VLKAAISGLAIATSHTVTAAMLAVIGCSLVVERVPGIRDAVAAQFKLMRETQERTALLLRDTEEQIEGGVPGDFESLSAFIVRSKTTTSAFANDALGVKSMWLYYTGDAFQHTDYLRGVFEERIFKAAELDREVDAVLASYEARVSRAENALLFRLRENGLDFPPTFVFPQLDRDRLQAISDDALLRTAGQTASKGRALAATEIITISAVQVGPKISKALRLTLLIRGSRVSLPTLVFSFLLGWSVDKYYEHEVTTQLDLRLDEIHTHIVIGTADVPGLWRQLQQHARERAALRTAVVSAHLRTRSEWISWCWWNLFAVLQPQPSGAAK
jgi:hypothetical protein